MSLNTNNMNGDNVSETIFSKLCNDKNNLDNKGFPLLRYIQLTSAQNELISVQRSLIRELLESSKEVNNCNTKNSNHQEQQIGVECDSMHTDVESIRNEICFVKSIRDLIKGSSGEEKVNNKGNGTFTKNYKLNQGKIEQTDKDTGFIYSGSSQNHYSPPINTINSFNVYNEAVDGGSMNINNVPFDNGDNEFSRESDFGQNDRPNDNMQSQLMSGSFQNNDYYNEPNEINGSNSDFLGEFKGFNSIYVGTGKENLDVHQLKQCLEENFGHVRSVRIIRNKNCAFAEFEEKQCFMAAIESGYVSLNGVNLKINKTFRKKKEN